jgi:MFS family permease
MLAAVYGVLLLASAGSVPVLAVCLLLMGLYYAATEGVLLALASSILPAERRATGLAVIASGIGGGKLVSSLLFGWLWQVHGIETATGVFAVALGAVAAVSMTTLRRYRLI